MPPLTGPTARYAPAPQLSYLNVHHVLSTRRTEAKEGGGPGPRCIVVGPTDSGKSTLCRLLCNWGVRMGAAPTFVDLDIGASGDGAGAKEGGRGGPQALRRLGSGRDGEDGARSSAFFPSLLAADRPSPPPPPSPRPPRDRARQHHGARLPGGNAGGDADRRG